MNYRSIPFNGEKVSTLGFGCMRFPTFDGDAGKIDRPRAIEMIRHAIDNGVTYFDTAYVYHAGKSEGLLGEALQDGYREKVVIATKLPTMMVDRAEQMEQFFNEELERLGVDCIDIYLMHALNKERFAKMKKLGMFEFIDKLVAEGKIRHPAFSFHDDAETFREIIDSYPWHVCQVQMNLLDEDAQATMDGVRYAHSKGIGVVVMEPLRGGMLTKTVPEAIMNEYKAANPDRTPAEWAFRWLLDKPEFMTILSGMSTMEQLEENIKIFSDADAGCLSDSERATLKKVGDMYHDRVVVGCTGCEYCQPCPMGINIPMIFKEYDQAKMFDNWDHFIKRYNSLDVKADACVRCEACVDACPQHFPVSIPDRLAMIHEEVNG